MTIHAMLLFGAIIFGVGFLFGALLVLAYYQERGDKR